MVILIGEKFHFKQDNINRGINFSVRPVGNYLWECGRYIDTVRFLFYFIKTNKKICLPSKSVACKLS